MRARTHVRAHARTHEINVPKVFAMTQAVRRKTPSPPATTPATAAPSNGRRIQVRRSGVHGKGVFAVAPIPRRVIRTTRRTRTIPSTSTSMTAT
jgi:hypothetical protein